MNLLFSFDWLSLHLDFTGLFFFGSVSFVLVRLMRGYLRKFSVWLKNPPVYRRPVCIGQWLELISDSVSSALFLVWGSLIVLIFVFDFELPALNRSLGILLGCTVIWLGVLWRRFAYDACYR